jgi:hypothetical protein
MNKWFRRAVGTAGVAGGMLLLGAGAAHAADNSALTPGDDLFTPAGGASNTGLALDTPGTRISTDSPDGGPLSVHPNQGQTGAILDAPGVGSGPGNQISGETGWPDVLRAVPLDSIVPMSNMGMPASSTESAFAPGGVSTPASPVFGLLSGLPLPGLSSLGGQSDGGVAPVNGTDAFVNTESAPLTEALPGLAGLPTPQGLPDFRSAYPLTADLPVLSGRGLPAVGSSTPLTGTVHPVNDMAVPLGGSPATESAAVPGLGGVQSLLQDNAFSGVPGLSGLPVVGNLTSAYTPKHAGARHAAGPRHAAADADAQSGSTESGYDFSGSGFTEGLPLAGGLPLVGSLPTALPLVSNLLAGGGGLL